MFIKFIKSLFFKNSLSFLKVGDVIWAKRYENDSFKVKIKEGHREGPYIVIRKARRGVYALECTSNGRRRLHSDVKLFIPKDITCLTKDSYVYSESICLIDDYRFIYRMGSLNGDFINRVWKFLYLINAKVKGISKISFDYAIGDIVEWEGNMFYIIGASSKHYRVVPVCESKKGKFCINGINYSFSFMSARMAKRPCKFRILNMADSDQVNSISLHMGLARKEAKRSGILERGKLILFDDRYYYIYGECGNRLLVYRIYLDSEASSDMYEIDIKNGHYYTLFEESVIDKSSNIKIVRGASSFEMDVIKKVKEIINNRSKSCKKVFSLRYPEFKSGSVIMDPDTLDKYIIWKRNGNKILYVSADDYSKRFEFDFDNDGVFDFELLERLDYYKLKHLKCDFEMC